MQRFDVTADDILEQMKTRPGYDYTAVALSGRMGIPATAIMRRMGELVERGQVVRTDHDKTAYWRVPHDGAGVAESRQAGIFKPLSRDYIKGQQRMLDLIAERELKGGHK